MNRERVTLALDTARSLADVLPAMEEEEILKALQIESGAQRRQTHLERMVVRLATLRAMRLKDELVREFTPWLAPSQSS